jgi:hypothetical protein
MARKENSTKDLQEGFGQTAHKKNYGSKWSNVVSEQGDEGIVVGEIESIKLPCPTEGCSETEAYELVQWKKDGIVGGMHRSQLTYLLHVLPEDSSN